MAQVGNTWRGQTAPPEYNHARLAETFKIELDRGKDLRPADVAWLCSVSKVQVGNASASVMCDLIINRWTLMQITERLKS